MNSDNDDLDISDQSQITINGMPVKKKYGYELTEEQWRKVDQWAIVPGRTLSEIARSLNLPHKNPRHVLESNIKRKYKLDPSEYIAQRQLVGIGMVRDAMFRDALDGKHPITQIFLSKNFLGLRDERIINTTDQDTSKSVKALQLMESIIKRIADKPTLSQREIQALERKNNKIENADYTIVKTHKQQPPLQVYDNNNNMNNNDNKNNIDDTLLYKNNE